MDRWTKIQSGSIYYALSKLEKEGLIKLTEEISIGGKVRKVYSITERGTSELKELVKQELSNPINEVGSDKFIIFPLLNTLNKDEISAHLQEHIQKLNSQKIYFEKWQNIKINEQTLSVEKISFEMMISNIDYQIKWHTALIQDIEACISMSDKISDLISVFDFSNTKDIQLDTAVNIEDLKYQILNNPDTSSDNLEQLIELLKK